MPGQPGSLPRAGRNLDPDSIAGEDFTSVRRGYDPDAVRDFLREVASEMRELRRRESELRAEAALAREQPPAELDESALASAVGAETSRILQTAHDAARDIVSRSERRASALVADAEAAFAERTRVAEAEASELLSRARADAAMLVAKAREDSREMVDAARDARRRILADLIDRRRSLHLQLEQLRAGKDALREIVESVSYSVLSSVEEVRERIEGAEEQARQAASSTTEPPAEDDLELEALLALTDEERVSEQPPGIELERRPVPSVPVPSVPMSPETPPSLGSVEPLGATEQFIAPTVEPTEVLVEPSETVVEPTTAVVDPSEENGADHDAGGRGVARDLGALFQRIRDSGLDQSASAPIELVVSEAPSEVATALDERLETETVDDEFSLLVRRDQLLGPPTAELGRSLKRVLRLQENELRDVARNAPHGSEFALLAPGPDTTAQIAEAAERPLRLAFAAGVSFVAEVLGAPHAEISEDGASEVAMRLSDEIVEPIRRRIESGLHEAGPDEGDPGAAVGAAFRDWRGSRIESVAADFSAWAFSAGTMAAVSALGGSVAWIADDGDTNCPDCDDNAIAGPQVAGGEFPTGHSHPPIHPGCRCLLAPMRLSAP